MAALLASNSVEVPLATRATQLQVRLVFVTDPDYGGTTLMLPLDDSSNIYANGCTPTI